MKALMFTTAILLATAASAQTYGTQSSTTQTTTPDATMTTTTTTDTTVSPDATTTTTMTSMPMASAPAIPNSGQQVAPSNADPEHDARGIAVISDPAVVPDGYNGFAATGMGGPLVDPATGEAIDAADDSYPACSATVTDNCIQLYERGVRESLAGWNRPTGGLRDDSSTTGMGGPVGEDEVGDNTPEDDALDVDVEPDGDIDVDGDLDNDGDNDLE